MWIHEVLGFLLQDRTRTANGCPQTPNEIDISESAIVSDQTEINGSVLMDSPSPTEKEFYMFEMVIRGLLITRHGEKCTR